ncbi:MAG TPA: FtsQ-type POTRA domain-containing protein [Micromonosporaceae bacterium]|nr:FtsQ-type POTRA domain-containing protein [Micromonosporaceae bacterium]
MTPGSSRGRGAAAGGAGPGGQAGRGGVRARHWRLVRASSDAVPASARRFMRRARRRRLRAALPWAVVGGVLALAGLAAWMVLGTGVFGLRHVRVVGAEILDAEQIRQAAAVAEGTPLARVDLAAVRNRVGALAPVDRVEVSRDWPGTLVIEVVERTAVAAVPQEGRFVVVDGSGVAFRVLAERPGDLPLVRLTEPGPEDAATRGALAVLSALTPQLRERLVEMVVDGPAEIKLLLRGGRAVIWGDASQGETKARVATALLDSGGTTIDVSAPDVVTIS